MKEENDLLNELLKAWYCHERGKLESFAVFKNETRLLFNKIKQGVQDGLLRDVDMGELKTKYKDDPHLKKFFESPITAVAINEKIEEILIEEQALIEKEKQHIVNEDELQRERDAYALYFLQSEKVRKIEEVLKEKIKDSSPEQLYKEFKSKKHST